MNLGKYRKTIVSVVGLAVVLLGSVYGAATWFAPLVSLLTALGVYATPNDKILTRI